MKQFLLPLKLLIPLLFVVASGMDLYSYSDQLTTERILKENRYFVNFINVSVTNFADEKRDIFKNAYEKHFNGEVAYLQSDYKRAFKRVYASQGTMVKLYEDIVRDHYLEGAKTILDTLAPGIIMSKNDRARLYLTLGYRDRTVSWTHYVSGEASNPKLHSYKLFKYEEAIKMARRAKRYGFLALFESQIPEVKIRIYNNLLAKEREKGTLFYNRFIDLSEQDVIRETGKSYKEYEEDLRRQAAEGKGGVPFEKKVQRRVRFRQEVKTAKNMLNHEFDRAEDILRKYVDDFNYKLMMATFDVLSQGGAAGTEGEEGQSSAAFGDKKINYSRYKVHLNDNYQRITRDSVLEGLLEEVKVEDDVEDSTGERESLAEYKKRRDGVQEKDNEKPELEKETGEIEKTQESSGEKEQSE